MAEARKYVAEYVRRLARRTAIGFAPGTHAFLDRLEAHLDGEPTPEWRGRVEEVRGYYPAWQQPSSSGNPSGQKK